MLRRAAIIGLFATALAAALITSAQAAVPRGPHLAVIVYREHFEPKLLLIGPHGQAPRQVEVEELEDPGDGPFISHRPIWSPDGREIAFFSFRVDHPGISLIDADGSNFRLLESGVEPFREPAFDPTTGNLVVWGSKTEPSTPVGSGPPGAGALWSLPTDGSDPQLLSNGPHSFVTPYSFAPDGAAAASVRAPRGSGPEAARIVTFDPRNPVLRTVVPVQANGNFEPAVSPDGSEIAYLHYLFGSENGGPRRVLGTDLMVVPFAGGKAVRLIRIAGQASGPSWDPSGSRISYTKKDAVIEINADGTCRTKVFSGPTGGSIGEAAWQPGIGRGVGPLSC